MNFINFGEVLFDVFSDKVTLGGAPLNAAAHMSRLGLEGIVVSAVGDDELGRQAIAEVKNLGLSTDGIAVTDKETGKAFVTLVNGNADYSFNEDNAWDNIPLTSNLPAKVEIVYFGTLAQRAEKSRLTLDSILENTKAEHVFFDVNIRKNYYSPEIIRRGLERATILKLNDDEVDIILSNAEDIHSTGLLGLEELKNRYNLELILLTLGGEGSMCLGDSWYRESPGKVTVVDTVGAGDSLSAGFLASYIKNGDIKEALSAGTKVANFVVSKRGAIPSYTTEELGL